MNPRRRTWCALLLLACGSALVGCGGGGDDMPAYGGMPGPGNGMDYNATPLVSDTLEFLRLRETSWKLRAEALRKRNMSTLRDAEQVERESFDALQKLKRSFAA